MLDEPASLPRAVVTGGSRHGATRPSGENAGAGLCIRGHRA